ncbi:glycosyltransferase [Globicatella sanguinis]
MNLEVLVATMHQPQNDFSLIKKMNIQTNAVIVNQCDRYSYHKLIINGNTIKWFDVAERGLSRSRNVAFAKATADLCLLADDDEILLDGYEEKICSEFNNNKKAGIITFNLNSIGNISKRYINMKRKRLRFFNIMRYGSARIAFRRKNVEDGRILFAPNFGAGTEISSGEDSIFLMDCLRKGIRAYSSPVFIANIDDGPHNSSWFKGYTEKYFINMGKIFTALSPKFSELWIIQYLLRHPIAVKEIGILNCYILMKKGKKEFRKRSL